IWSRLHFSAKVTARNILRYKKRFYMTVLGIGGCTAILLTGFGLRDSIRMVAVNQFDSVYRFDFIITSTGGGADKASLERYLASVNEITGWQYQCRENIDVRLGPKGPTYEAVLLAPDDMDRIGEYIRLVEPHSGKLLMPTDNTVVITQKLASLLGVTKGAEITILNEGDEEWTLVVGGVTEHYVGHYIYMKPRQYASLFGKEPEFTTIVGKMPGLEDVRRDEISAALLENDGVHSLSFNATVRDFYKDTLDALNIVVFVLIVCGALLSFIVLTCLTGINIDERKREIATLKVLGFFDGEAASYIFRENIVNTVAGTAVGLGLGVLLHQYIIRTVELDMVYFGKIVMPMSYVYSIILTFLFTFAVNAAMAGDIREIDMIESLKSVE
ncbi:MAG: ABC transporter permease, partial [Clostridiales bacterium]|nr:ABC transporter permease [Clostridiales bacterium]